MGEEWGRNGEGNVQGKGPPPIEVWAEFVLSRKVTCILVYIAQAFRLPGARGLILRSDADDV
jgi:hypothetical protein